MTDLPGQLHERPWRDFGHNRSEALELARGQGDYTLVMDADGVLEIAPGFRMPTLTADSYDLLIVLGGIAYHRTQLLNSALPWRYVGVLHEYPACPEAKTAAFLPGLKTIMYPDGARSRDPLKYRRDALVLEQGLLDEPNNERYVFYLAQSYRDAGVPESALQHYRRRAAKGGWAEEVWYSLYQIGCVEAGMGAPWPQAMASLLAAWQFDPTRAEPLFQIAMYYQKRREHHVAHLFFARAMTVPPPEAARLFVEHALYTHLIRLEYAVACYWTGRHGEAITINDQLLAMPSLAPDLIELARKNRDFSVTALNTR
jgi:tetratricopeptide (TPR) repeat protein